MVFDFKFFLLKIQFSPSFILIGADIIAPSDSVMMILMYFIVYVPEFNNLDKFRFQPLCEHRAIFIYMSILCDHI